MLDRSVIIVDVDGDSLFQAFFLGRLDLHLFDRRLGDVWVLLASLQVLLVSPRESEGVVAEAGGDAEDHVARVEHV